jgi:glycosyltransferase involved in cell wall biosynthesis
MAIKYKILEIFCILNKGVEYMKPLISIIMPIYNCNDFLEESIRSISEQTYTNWELIIVNDGSQDNPEKTISEIEDNRINLINLRHHQGLNSAFREGYKYAKGDFIIRQDGDDISAPTRLEIQEDYLESNPRVGMISCLISCFTRDQLFRKDCIFIEKIQNHYISYEEIKKSIISGFIPILFPTLMIRKELMDKVINYENHNITYDDHTELLLDLLRLSPVKKINTILYSYRRHKDAYHIVNQKQYNLYTSKLLKDPDVKNHLQYRDFYNNFNSPVEKLSQLNEKSEIRVLMLIDALNVGGTETHVLNITKKLMDMGIYVVIATSGGPMEVVLQSYGIKIIKLPIEGDYIPNKKKFGMIKLIKNIIDEEKINLIHSHLFASMQLASELYRMYKIPYVVTIHGLFYPNDILYSSCIKASNVIAVSEPVRDMLDLKLGSRIKNIITVIPNGVSSDLIKNADKETDVRKELHIPVDSKILCYCSRLDWNKTEAARVFLFSFSQLTKEFSDLHAIIVGDGAGKEGIEKEAQIINQMVNKTIVHVVGAKVNVIPYFLESDIVIGTARVALEAMICKKPVIAIGNQGYTGLVTESNRDIQWKMYFGDHGALEKTNVSRLVRDIRYLLYSSKRRRRIGMWGRLWCERVFNNEKTVKEIIEIYKKSLNL